MLQMSNNLPMVQYLSFTHLLFSNAYLGTTLTSFSLAVNDIYNTRDGEKVERTNWFRVVVVNDKTQEFVQKHITKGSRVYVDGSLNIRKWTDSVGLERTTVEVSVRQKGDIGLIHKGLLEDGEGQSNNSGVDEDYH